MSKPIPAISEYRFWSKVSRHPVDCCIWIGAQKEGYGIIGYGKRPAKLFYAHRVAWKLVNNEDPGNLCVCHTCDNTLCVRPSHLFLGTHSDNMADREAKNRNVNYVGELHGKSKLTELEVRKIRESTEPYSVLAEVYAVTKQNIGAIKRGETWKHL